MVLEESIFLQGLYWKSGVNERLEVRLSPDYEGKPVVSLHNQEGAPLATFDRSEFVAMARRVAIIWSEEVLDEHGD